MSPMPGTEHSPPVAAVTSAAVAAFVVAVPRLSRPPRWPLALLASAAPLACGGRGGRGGLLRPRAAAPAGAALAWRADPGSDEDRRERGHGNGRHARNAGSAHPGGSCWGV